MVFFSFPLFLPPGDLKDRNPNSRMAGKIASWFPWFPSGQRQALLSIVQKEKVKISAETQ
jgi:hypothetical protein